MWSRGFGKTVSRAELGFQSIDEVKIDMFKKKKKEIQIILVLPELYGVIVKWNNEHQYY